MIDSLIDKQDNFEIVRDKIATILVAETANQQALASAASKDPNLWKLRIFTERSNPWEQFSNAPSDKSPLVNVWYDSSTFIAGSSNVSERQKAEATFNIDCYGYATSSNNGGGGHNPGDRDAAFEVQRAIRLVRNILMAAEYTYLESRGLVWQRWPQSITVFQPQQNDTPIQNIIAARVALRVGFNEFAPQITPETLELVSTDVRRTEDGEIVLEADYDYTT